MGKPTAFSNLVSRFRQPQAHGGHDQNGVRNDSTLPISSSNTTEHQSKPGNSTIFVGDGEKSLSERDRDNGQHRDAPDDITPLPRTSAPLGAQSINNVDTSTIDTPAAGTQPSALVSTMSTEKTIEQKKPIPQRIKAGTIRFFRHTKHAITHSYVNIFLIFVPIGIAAHVAGLRPEIVFAMNAIAVIPLASILTHATETVALNLGDTLGALLNVTFGNAVELIVFIVALVKNEIRIVQASILGSILSNLLLVSAMPIRWDEYL